MMRKYIISIGTGQPYPFDGQKENCSEVVVRKFIPFRSKQEEKTLHHNLNILLSLESPHIIQITRVLQLRGKHFVVDYEYVPQNLNKSQKMAQNAFLIQIKDKLEQLTQHMAQNGIKIDLKMEDIGLTQEGQPKVFLGLNFQVVPQQDQRILLNEYQSNIEKLFQQQVNFRHSLKAPSEISDYSYRLDKKITEIQDKINRRKRKKSRSSKGRSSPQKQKESGHTSSDQMNKKLVVNPAGDAVSSKLSNGSITSEKTRYSLIQAQQHVKPKVHKSSFNDFTTTSHKLNESREESLKKRFESALEKTQQAFKTYDKHFKRSRKF